MYTKLMFLYYFLLSIVPSNTIYISNLYDRCQSSAYISLNNGVFPSTTFEVFFLLLHRMSLNLYDPVGNIVFHFSPRSDEHRTILNTKLGKNWDTEVQPSEMPFTVGEKYHVLAAYESEGYRIYVDGDEYTFFSHRSPNMPVKMEVIEANIYQVSYSHGMPKWAIRSSVAHLNITDFTPEGIKVPFLRSLQNPFFINSSITVVGFAENNASFIGIDLLGSDDDDVIFNFSIRFKEGHVIRNTKYGGSWGLEERNGGLPLQPGKKFTVSIVCEQSALRTYVNGQEFVLYDHRAPFNNIGSVRVEGHAKLLKIIQN